MKKYYRNLTVLAVMALFGASPVLAQESEGYVTTIPFTETFDDESHYALGGSLPDGWATTSEAEPATGNFARTSFYDTMVEPYSGDYFVTSYGMSRDRLDVLYTPLLEMEAGREYTISFYAFSSGRSNPMYIPTWKVTVGGGQTVDLQTVEISEETPLEFSGWTKVEAKYTPEENGQYSVAVQIGSGGWSMSGSVNIDDFSIEAGEAPEPPAEGYETTIPFTESFDDETHYALEGSLPDGWLSESATGSAFAKSDMAANSGDNCVMSYAMSSGRQDVLYTPMLDMEGGKEYAVSFYVMNEGYSTGRNPSFEVTAGTGQSADEQSVWLRSRETMLFSQWTLVETTFTPEEDGQYCIAVQVSCAISSSGLVYIDDFTVEPSGRGEEPGGDEWEPSIPYAEDFDDASHYDGISNLPIGWVSTGEDPFFTASSDARPAISGSYYMVAQETIIASRKDIAYSPLLEMEGGVEYTVSFYLWMPGGDGGASSFKFTVGADQSSDMHTQVLAEVSGERITDWRRMEYTFTPTATGEYCFAFWALSESAYCGHIGIENFRLYRTDAVLPPDASFDFGNTLTSIFSGMQTVFPGQYVRLINNTSDAQSYLWSVSGTGATITDPTAAAPMLVVEESGSYTVTLQATNAGGTSEATGTLRATVPATGDEDAVQTTKDSGDRIMGQSDTPAFAEDGTVIESGTYETYYDYVSGVNPYYRAFAERFEMPEGCDVEISSINFGSQNFYLFAETIGIGKDENGEDIYSNFDADKEMTVAIYGEKDGKPDTANPLGSVTGRIADMIQQDYYEKRMNVEFDSPVTVDGTFYVAFEFDELQITPWDPSAEQQANRLTRSYIGFQTRVHANGETSLWVRPEKAIAGSDFKPTGEYCRADLFSPQLRGYSVWVVAWLTYGDMNPEPVGVDDVAADAAVKVYVSADGENFKLAGLQEGCPVRVCSVGGTALFAGEAQGSEMVIPASGWNRGVYVISAGNQSIKVIK